VLVVVVLCRALSTRCERLITTTLGDAAGLVCIETYTYIRMHMYVPSVRTNRTPGSLSRYGCSGLASSAATLVLVQVVAGVVRGDPSTNDDEFIPRNTHPLTQHTAAKRPAAPVLVHVVVGVVRGDPSTSTNTSSSRCSK